MSEIYESDQDQVEKIKKWWAENGRSTVIGLVVGLSSVFGWASWQTHQIAQTEAASALYTLIESAAENKKFANVEERAQTLLAEFPDSGYASLATFYRAKAAMEAGRADAHKAHLQWIFDNAKETEYRDIARLRLARIALDGGDSAKALGLLDGVKTNQEYQGVIDALRGDIAVSKGDTEGARKAYTNAVDALGANTPQGIRTQLLLDDLGSLNVPGSPGA
ncbi:MAG: tetratricopeptide repeat protein [Chromatiales bacterium]|jgi:predicted negative regulator of RcsB-dependent stress response|nr:tetratricopeptide repeat protein [Chromatiales bacterium]